MDSEEQKRTTHKLVTLPVPVPSKPIPKMPGKAKLAKLGLLGTQNAQSLFPPLN